MLTLFHAPQSRSSRIVWLLEELGVDYDIRYVDIFRSMTGSGGRDAANPHPDGKVPALTHNDALVTESAAVALYLTDLFPEAGLGAAAGSAERAAYVTWLAWGREFSPENPLLDAYLARIMDRPANAMATAKDGDLPGAVQAA